VNTVVFRKALERRHTGSERVAAQLVQAGYASGYTPNRWRRRSGGKVYTLWVLTLTPLGEDVRATGGGRAEPWVSA
jgi:hypothetical protein